MRRFPLALLLMVLLASCADSRPAQRAQEPAAPAAPQDGAVGAAQIQPPLASAPAPAPSPRLALPQEVEGTHNKVRSYFEGRRGLKARYIQLDKPLYRPGESIWIRAWALEQDKLAPYDESQLGQTGALFQLISPKGAVVMERRVPRRGSVTTNDFELPQGVPGGEYKIRVTGLVDNVVVERSLVVSHYEPPRVKKKLDFVREAYSAGDSVEATLTLARPTGEPLAHHPIKALVRVDNGDLEPVTATTNEHGGAVLRFSLPEQILGGDGLLTVLVEEGGVTESISRPIPIVVDALRVSLFPEGGQLVSGLPGRVYFRATTPLGKPADISGVVVDDQGKEVTTFSSDHDGLGRFELEPVAGRHYKLRLTEPSGNQQSFPVPDPQSEGCVLRSFDDYDSQEESIRVGVRCTKAGEITVTSVMREQVQDAAQIKVEEGQQAVAYLKGEGVGVARVTVWRGELPQAERLVFRGRRERLQIKLTPDQERYSPRDQVKLQVQTLDGRGEPVASDVALSVVDDTVLSFADDRSGHMLSRLLLERELSDEVHEPNFYFDLTQEQGAVGLDRVMGALGWRRFAWSREIFNPPPPPAPPVRAMFGGVDDFDGVVVDLMEAEGAVDEPLAQGNDLAAVPEEVLEPEPEPVQVVAGEAMAKEAKLDDLRADRQQEMPIMARDEEWDKRIARKPQPLAWGLVRLFPVPDHKPGYQGPRTDFRDTLFWAPSVKTGEDGLAQVSFPVSDAVTSFRVVAEGVGGGLLGHQESVLASSLPFSMAVKLPNEVSAGDKMELPLTLTNDQRQPLEVQVEASLGEGLSLESDPQARISLSAGESRTLLFPVQVTGAQGQAQVSFVASAGSLRDEFVRQVQIVPVGFPQEFAASGQLEGKATYEVDLTGAEPGSVKAAVRFYPSPVATMVSGLEGLLRQPGGCFEQASSTNYPNIMVMRYLKEYKANKPELLMRSQKLMDQGYLLLAGYESPQKGYEWFGGDPGHEALTAYGLMEFSDMRQVWDGVDPSMVQRTAAWLKQRRDGKGGFLRDSKALDNFGRASGEVTDAYITYALVEGGFAADFLPEVKAQRDRSRDSQDQYLMALAANVLLKTPGFQEEGKALAARLAAGQGPEGAWTRADHSITRSGGQNLVIETTALSIMALLLDGGHPEQVRRGVEWLNKNRSGFGQWGTTQATVLSLKAMTRYAASTRKTSTAGSITVLINGQVAQELVYGKEQEDTLLLDKLAGHLKAGPNKIEVIHEGSRPMPFGLVVEHHAQKPNSSPASVVALSTSLRRQEVPMGEVVRMEVEIKNKTQEGQPMTLARVGLPGGLSFQTWQLKELRESGQVAFYETGPREVILYLRDMKPGAAHKIPLDLVATVPGSYEAPASRAYLYYTDEHKTWQPGQRVVVRQPAQ